MVLEVTARNEKGEKIFSGEQVYEMVGMDEKGERTFDSWKIRKINAERTIQPGQVTRKEFEFAPPKGTQSVVIEAVLSYQIAPDAQPVLMAKTANTLPLQAEKTKR
ncbi:MAG: hypothetical protein HYY20_06585 [Candidatus Tectomicrobia bacterium]|uniref:Uncharacterized protein n=1 Tax=Tectimicrobiota bacterium TaxID=2528274 RepID=A0A932CP87_UNCTE|nr:hypothetical protein [Candidatus Tectomicrobia bacterium]